MHLPYPPRKDSNPARYMPAHSSRTSRFIPPILRRIRLKGGIVICLVLISFFYIASSLRSAGSSGGSTGGRRYAEHVPSGHPVAVIVTVLDEVGYNKGYLETIKENRRIYAENNGYEVFFPSTVEYKLDGAPESWTKVVAMRHALTKFPDATFFWFLDQDAFIMDPKFTVQGSIMDPKALENVMIKDHPVVPPDSIIKTFAHLKGTDVDLVLTQDKEGLSVGSFVVRNGEWARFFFETWFDPIYRSYNFQKAETHALEHIVQWHPTILSKLAIVPQRSINSYSTTELGAAYEPGDITVRFPSCGKSGPEACEKEARKFMQQWRNAFKGS